MEAIPSHTHAESIDRGFMDCKRILFLCWTLTFCLLTANCSSTLWKSASQDKDPLSESIPQALHEISPSKACEAGSLTDEKGELKEYLYGENEPRPAEAEDVTFLNNLNEPEDPPDPSQVIPITNNDKVDYHLELFQGRQGKWIQRSLERSGRYIDRMQQIFRDQGLPDDLVYLAVIESGFNPYAYSRAGAMGIWQFMPATGRRYGLKINWWVDERRDLEKSTRAAASYLKDLYAIFEDWYLAAAAYNAGEGKLLKGLKRYDSNCFWDLSQYRFLRSETKNYVPRFLAALTIAKDPEKYGIKAIDPEPPLIYEIVTVPDATDLAVIAKGCGKSLSLLQKLNPQLRRGCTPPSYPDYEVKIPQGTRESFLAYYQDLSPRKRLTFRRHRIKRGETLSHIASRYGVSVHSIMSMNKLKNKHRVREGKNLVIPLPLSYRADRTYAVSSSYGRSRKKTRSLPDYSHRGYKKVVHKVTNGDSLWKISRRYGVSVSSLCTWNRIYSSSRIHPGQKVVVWLQDRARSTGTNLDMQPVASLFEDPQQEISYIIRPGDTLWDIARKYKVSLRQISQWNNLDIHRPIRPGLRLKIYKGMHLKANMSSLP